MAEEETITEEDKEFIEDTIVRRYPAFQYSVFVGDRQEQLVIRADTYKEFLEQKKLLDGIVSKMRARKTADSIKRHEPIKEEEEELQAFCKIHNVEMKRREGKYGEFWSHAKQIDGEWVYCSGKGFGK